MKTPQTRVMRIVAVLVLLLVATGVAYADPPREIADVPSTAGGYGTWATDLLDVERVAETGNGVYVALVDSGLTPNWRDYFPEERIATKLGTGFYQQISFKAFSEDPCNLAAVEFGPVVQTGWIGSTSATHGTHVASAILGYFYRSNLDAAMGYELPPIAVRGAAPEVTLIPVKVLHDYEIPAMPQCDPPMPAQKIIAGSEAAVAAGIDYATDLALAGYRPMVINLSVGGYYLSDVMKAAIDRAIANDVVVVAAAGNFGVEEWGMIYPGAYPPVISVGAVGWTKQWLDADGQPFNPVWWLQSDLVAYNDVAEGEAALDEVYVADFSSRPLEGQELDVVVPGAWVNGPWPGGPGYAHVPWWSHGIADLKVRGRSLSNFLLLPGTSVATPYATAVVALMLQKSPGLTQAQVQSILKSTALPIAAGQATAFAPDMATGEMAYLTYTWGSDAAGAGLVQAAAALAAVP